MIRLCLRAPWLVALALLLASCVSTPSPRIALGGVSTAQQARAESNLRVFAAVWSLVADKHFDPKLQGVDWKTAGAKYGMEAATAADEKALFAALNAMLDLLKDSHTHALTPLQAQERRTRVRVRTGFNAWRIEGRFAVAEVLAGSPAELAGIRPGWVVVSRNGQAVGDRLDFRPQDGEVAEWGFLDEHDRPVTCSLVARPLSTAPRQVVRELPGGSVYLRFDGFDGRDRRWLSEQLKTHSTAPGVVIDLRRNPGGETWSLGISLGEFFNHAVDCGLFITRSGARSVKNSWQLGSAHYGGRVVVLVDGLTASAAEIFAAVLQEHSRAKVIGRKTAGAVLASRFLSLPGGGELQLSLEDYVTPRGRRLEGSGVVPDVTVPFTLPDLREGRDPDVDTALRVLRES